MPKANAIPVPEAGVMDPIFDFLLFKGDFSWVYWLAIWGFCINASRWLKESQPTILYAHGYVFLILTQFGGSMATGWVCGMPMSIVANESLPTVMLCAWTAVYFVDPLFKMLKAPVVRTLTVSLWEFMRAHVVILCAGQGAAWMAGNTIKNFGYPVPFVAPILCGILGGCGGGFQPLNKGLDPLAGGLNWRIMSGIIGSVVLQLGLRDPHTKEAIDDDVVKAIVVCFFFLAPLVNVAPMLGANPDPPVQTVSAAKKNK